MITVMRMDMDGTKLKPIWKDVYRWYLNRQEWKARTSEILEGLKYTNQVEEIESGRAKRLYGKDMLISVSRLEKYAACPFAYFIKYGLYAKDRKIYKASAPDMGTFMHNVLNEFSIMLEKEKTSWREVDRSFCSAAVNIIVDNMVGKLSGNILNSSPRYRYLGERLKRMLTTALWIISEHIRRSNFEPEGYEEGFGPYDKYPPIKIILENGEEINLIGRIDRIDVMETEADSYVRIIDYKSGNKDIKLTDIYYGLQLQLLIYLDAILKGVQKEDGASLIPAGILYFKIDNPIISSNGGREISDEDIEKAILKELKLKGLLLDNIDVIQGMDNAIDGYSDIVPASIKKDGTLGRSRIVSNEQFDILRSYVKSTIKDLSTEMLRGNITIRPYKKSKETPCKFCEYSAVCQFDTSIKGNNYRVINEKSDDEIWTLMEKQTEGGDSNE
jgi:ATP-dependent helicase/nuclease subunit B